MYLVVHWWSVLPGNNFTQSIETMFVALRTISNMQFLLRYNRETSFESCARERP